MFWLSLFCHFAWAAHPSLNDLIPAGTRDVDLYSYRGNSDHAADKVEALLRKDMSLWLSVMKQAHAGNQVPYDPRMGISREEFRQLVESYLPSIHGTKVGVAKLSIDEAFGQVTFKLDRSKVMAKGIRFDRASATIYVPGFHRTGEGFGVTLEHFRGGRVQGYRWEVQAVTEGTSPSGQWVSITIGKFATQPTCVFDVEFRKFAGGKLLFDESFEARYQCGKG